MKIMSKTNLSLTQSLLDASIVVPCGHQVRPNNGMTPEKFGAHLKLIRTIGFETISIGQLHGVIAGKENPALQPSLSPQTAACCTTGAPPC
jgi:hypothetical protein